MEEKEGKMEYVLDNICKNYGKKCVLSGVNCKFVSGSMVGVLNGTGKTTLFNILGGTDRDFSGDISLRGNEVSYMSSRILLPEYWKISDALNFYRRFYQFDGFRAEQMLEEANLPQKLRFLSLSDGMRRYVAFTLCFCVNARVYLFDEPLTNLDARFRSVIVDELIGMALRDKIVLIATHEIKEFENLFTHCVILKQGKLSRPYDTEEIRASGYSLEEFYCERA